MGDLVPDLKFGRVSPERVALERVALKRVALKRVALEPWACMS